MKAKFKITFKCEVSEEDYAKLNQYVIKDAIQFIFRADQRLLMDLKISSEQE